MKYCDTSYLRAKIILPSSPNIVPNYLLVCFQISDCHIRFKQFLYSDIDVQST